MPALTIFNKSVGLVSSGRGFVWLRSVVVSPCFAVCGSGGPAVSGGASAAYCVRPITYTRLKYES